MDEDTVWGRRARTMAELQEISGRTTTREDMIASVRAFEPRATDVIITPDGKCGTTLLQQTFHTLRTRGDFEFDDISRVVPWIETAMTLGIDINAEQRASPRGFKSHLPWSFVPKGAKYVVALRDPQDAFVSAFRFIEGWYLEPGAVDMATYIERSASHRPGDGWDRWSHLVGWWEQRDNPDVLLLSFDAMSSDRESMIRRLAAFCGIALDTELLDLTLERTSREFMLAHKDRFDDAMLRAHSETVGGLPPDGDSAKVRPAGSGPRRDELPARVRQRLEEIWSSDVEPATGFESFTALDAALRERQ